MITQNTGTPAPMMVKPNTAAHIRVGNDTSFDAKSVNMLSEHSSKAYAAMIPKVMYKKLANIEDVHIVLLIRVSVVFSVNQAGTVIANA